MSCTSQSVNKEKSEGSGQAHVQPQINDIMVNTGQFITKCIRATEL